MKILKDPHHSPMFLPLALAGKMRLVCTVMVYFDFDDPETPLADREMWPEVMKLLPQPPVLETGQPKPGAEVLLAGKCFAPDAKPRQAAQVSLAVGGMKKSLNVFGDRHWLTAGQGRTISDPAPFTVMPLTWERAFGGPNDPRNPKGTGMAPDKPQPGQPVKLPNVEDPASLVGSPEDTPEPASFLPRDVMHPERQKLTGTYDDAWKTERWPYYPDDFNPEFFMAAPRGQRMEGFFKGGEPIEIVNMHPKKQLISSRVPQFAVRLFMTRKKAPKAPPEEDTFEEVSLRRDTLWLFPEANRGVIVFRGAFTTERDDMADLRYVYLATEPMGQTPFDLPHYLEAQTKRLAAMKPVKPQIPDINLKVNRELLKFNRVYKDIAQTKAQAMGQTPVMPREPAEIAAMGKQAITAGLATLDKMEAMALEFQQKFGWRATLDPASFAPRRAQLEATAQKIDQAAAKATQVKADLTSKKAAMLAETSQRMKSSIAPEHLAKAGIDPDNLLPEKGDGFGPWHEQGFAFAVNSRRTLENDPALMGRLKSHKLSARTLSKGWVGYNPEPFLCKGTDWGLPQGDFTIPRGLVLPRFEAKKLVRLLVVRDWPEVSQMPESGFLVPGSDPTPLWLPAPDESAPVVVANLEMEARLMEQEVGDVCHVATMHSEDKTPPPAAAKTLKEASHVLVLTQAGQHENLSPAVPFQKLSGKAVWLVLPKGQNALRAAGEGVDLRELVLEALPPTAVGIPEDEPEPAFGPAPPKKRPKMPDIAGLVQATLAEVRAFHEAKFEPIKAQMKDMENQAREAMAKHGKDYDQMVAEAKNAPRTPFDQLGQKMHDDILAKRDELKKMGVLTPDKEEDMVKAAGQARQLGADSEARWQDGQQKLAEAAKKIEAAKAAKAGGMPPEMKAKFAEAGMDIEAMVARGREEVIAMHAAGKSLAWARLAGVDLSGLDLSGADFTGCALGGTLFKGARLDGCTFAKAQAQSADFSGASLKGARFDQAMLGKTSFKKASLQGASFHQASFKQSDLSGADFSGATMHLTSVQKSDLTGAVFSGASLKLAVVQECLAKNAVVREATLERVLIRKSELDGADFTGSLLDSSQVQECTGQGVRFAKCEFRKGAIAQCRMPGIDLTDSRARHTSIRESSLPGADVRNASLSACRVEGSDLTRARMRGLSARGTSFPGSDLEGADMHGIDLLFGSLSKTRIVSADLSGANCFGVDFHKAVVGQTRFAGTNLTMTALENKADLLE